MGSLPCVALLLFCASYVFANPIFFPNFSAFNVPVFNGFPNFQPFPSNGITASQSSFSSGNGVNINKSGLPPGAALSSFISNGGRPTFNTGLSVAHAGLNGFGTFASNMPLLGQPMRAVTNFAQPGLGGIGTFGNAGLNAFHGFSSSFSSPPVFFSSSSSSSSTSVTKPNGTTTVISSFHSST